MTVNVSSENEKLTAVVEGKIDSVTSSQLESAIKNVMTDQIKSVIIDMEKVDFISSKGLRVLVSLYKSLPSKDMKLVNPGDMVVEVLRLSGLLNVFRVETK